MIAVIISSGVNKRVSQPVVMEKNRNQLTKNWLRFISKALLLCSMFNFSKILITPECLLIAHNCRETLIRQG